MPDLSNMWTQVTAGADQTLQRFGNGVPSPHEILEHLQTMGVWQGALLLAVGLVYLLQGWKVFKVLVIVNTAALGVYAGSFLGSLHSSAGSLYGAIAGGILLAVLAWPLMKFAISLMGGLAGGFAGYQLWRYVATVWQPEYLKYSWVGAIVAAVLLGVLAFFIFRTVVMLFTSFQGSMITVSGILAIVFQHPLLLDKLVKPLETSPHLLPILILVPALIGFIVQAVGWRQMDKKPRPAAQPQPQPQG